MCTPLYRQSRTCGNTGFEREHGRFCGANLNANDQSEKRLLSGKEQGKAARKELAIEARRKSDKAIVVKKFL